jgi:hypothetical protein
VIAKSRWIIHPAAFYWVKEFSGKNLKVVFNAEKV